MSEDRVRLLRKAVQGDAVAQEELIQEYLEFIEQHLRHEVGSSDDRASLDLEGVVNVTLMQAFQGLSNGDFTLPTTDGEAVLVFETWLRRIATNRLIDARRTAGAEKRGGGRQQITSADEALLTSNQDVLDYLAQDSLTASRVVARNEARTALEQAFAFLKETSDDLGKQYFDAFHMHVVEQRTLDEIATALHCTEGQVRNLLRSAKKRLQEQLGSLSLYLSRKG